MSYRILVTGSRYWEDRKGLFQVLETAARGLNKVTVVHGACPTGADSMASEWCQMYTAAGITEEAHPADWNQYGKAAGPKRNQQMVDMGANLCVAFLMKNSRGTKDCIKRAHIAGIEVLEFWPV